MTDWRKWSGRGPSRRAFLGGAAAMIGLPWMESLAHAVPGPNAPPLRLLFWYMPNGIRMDRFTPIDTGSAYTLSELLTPLAAHRDKMLVLSNVSQMAGTDSVGGDHARGTASFLTAMRASRPGLPVDLGPSVDFVASQSAGAQGTVLPSLHLASAIQPSSGNCDSGYPCAFQNTITWSGPSTPVPPRVDPVATFNTLFQGANNTVSAAEAARRHARRTSVLDYVHAEATSLTPQLSANDRQKLDQYLTGVRELELRLQNNPPNNGVSVCDPGTVPSPYLTLDDHLDQLTDLMVKAVECDATRVLSLMADASGSYRSFPWLGVPESHHEMSHWGAGGAAEAPHRLAQWQAVQAWHIARFGDLLTRLDAIQDADGSTLLDNCLVYFSSEIADGDAHNHNDMPVILAGGGRGCVNTGQHLRMSTRTPLANLFLGMLDQFGAPQSTFGMDGTEILPGVFRP